MNDSPPPKDQPPIEEGLEWVLPENMKKWGEDGYGLYGLYEAFADGSDLESAQPHALTNPDLAKLYARNIVGHLSRLGIDLSGNVLDAGCALGVICDAFHHVLSGRAIVHGIDLAPNVISKIQKRYPECQFKALSADELTGYPDEYFSLVHYREFYPFSRSANPTFHMRFLEAAFPKLKPGGIAVAVQIVSTKGLADSLAELREMCRRLGYGRVYRQVVVPNQVYRRLGDNAHHPVIYWGIALAGLILESISSSKVSFIYCFEKLNRDPA